LRREAENRAPIDMSQSDAILSADALDHLAQPAASEPAERRALVYALVAAALLHFLIPIGLLLLYWLAPHPAPPAEEIPVEIVVEPPPPPPPPKQQEKPPPPPQPEDERPAYDAPSAATEEKANRESPDRKSTAPKPMTEPAQESPGAPQPSEKQAATQEQKPAAPTQLEAKPASEADQRASPAPADAEADATPLAETVEPRPAPPPAPPAKAPTGAPIPTFEELPQYQFAHAATESSVAGGNADSRYLTIVYGMIRNHFREPHERPPHAGAIVFTVDESGNLVEHRVVNPSGSPNYDLALTNAVIAAAPYPAPPNWQPKSMRLTYPR
jgi:periplasmic protein TonB